MVCQNKEYNVFNDYIPKPCIYDSNTSMAFDIDVDNAFRGLNMRYDRLNKIKEDAPIKPVNCRQPKITEVSEDRFTQLTERNIDLRETSLLGWFLKIIPGPIHKMTRPDLPSSTISARNGTKDIRSTVYRN